MQISAIGSFTSGQSNAPGMNPDAYARIYAQQNGISFEEAKSKLRAMYGEPQKPEEVNQQKNVQQKQIEPQEDEKAQIAAQLRALGIPDNIIQRGPAAVGEYAKEHNIQLPGMQPPQGQNSFTGQDQISEMNKHFLLKKRAA
jgi:hypothetical protein